MIIGFIIMGSFIYSNKVCAQLQADGFELEPYKWNVNKGQLLWCT
jgi:hypothetical protein